ncbi:MAG: UDP-3-O-(3-hydroxymyristoyl)glucosamine N-acyltransferase [Bacteroidetes bacterium]|nr:UDP-3-O-(3-hydroxymyristoyl)glucosamine N-acyltransferase [Bacteroidota bacterium]
MNFTVGQIAELVGGQVVGDAGLAIQGLCRIEEGAPALLSFLHSDKYFHHLYTTQATAVLVPQTFQPEKPAHPTLIKVQNPYFAFNILLQQVWQESLASPEHEQPSFIHPSARLGKDVYVGAFAYIGKDAVVGDGARIYPNSYVGPGTRIGAETILYAGVTVYHGCEVGARCILHSGVVIGSDGFGFLQTPGGESIKIPQVGNVVLEDDVEIGAGTCIDRATLGSTVIRRGVKLDNLIQVAHNTEIGSHTVIAAQAGISGSSKIGSYCMIGGQTGMVGHIHIADRTQVGAKSGLSKHITEPGMAYRGAPAHPLREQLKMEAALRQLPELLQRVNQLELLLSRLQVDNS